MRTLQTYLQTSRNREAMALLYAESLLRLLQPQARPVVAEEAKAYIQRGEKKSSECAWWPLRCHLRALGLFCSDEQMAKVMVSR